jgi:hypothetical protein
MFLDNFRVFRLMGRAFFLRLLLLFLAVLMSVPCLAAGAYASDWNWLGGYDEDDVDLAWFTEDQYASEFYIGTAKQLAGLAALLDSENDLYGTYQDIAQGGFADTTIYLTADIDLATETGVYWRPMGDFVYIGGGAYEASATGTHFKGTFDGRGHMVRYVSDPDEPAGGLFSVLNEAGTVKNLSVDARISTNTADAGRSAGGGITIVNMGGVISDCSVSADISSTLRAGGIAVHNRGDIRNCAVSGVLSAQVDSSFFL